MPQLDSVTWFPQILWLIIIFFVLYSVLLQNYSPLCFKNQNLRSLKIKKHYNSIIFYDYMNVEMLYKQWFFFKKLLK
jgi:hypothetical protein